MDHLTIENGVSTPATALLSENADIYQTIFNNIQEAQQEILIASGFITDQEIISLLGDRASAGVKVRVIVSDKPVNRIDLLKKEQTKGMELYVSPTIGNGMMHKKFLVFDRKTACIGSYNLTRNARENNKEQLLVNHESQIIQEFVDDFESMVAEIQSPTQIKTPPSSLNTISADSVSTSNKTAKNLPSFEMPNPAKEPYTGFANELERLIHGEMGDFNRAEMHKEGYDHAKLANGDSNVLTKAMDSLYQQFKNSIEVNDGKIMSIGTRLKSYTEEKKAFLRDQSNRKEKSHLMDLEGYEKQLVRSIQSNELEMKALSTAVQKKKLVHITQLEAENKHLTREIKDNELEFVKPPINWAELSLYSILGFLAITFINIFYTSAGYIWLFGAKDAQVALDMGYALDVPEVFDPKWPTKIKAYGLNGLTMVLLFPVIPLLLAFIDRALPWKERWKNFFYFSLIGLFDFFIAYKIAKTIGRVEYLSGKILKEPSLGEIVLSDDFISVFILGALVLTLFKFVSKKLLSIPEERSLSVHMKKKQKLNEQLQEEIEANDAQIRKEQGEIMDIENKHSQMELEMDHLRKELDLIPSKEERIKADFHSHLNVQIAYLENTLQRYMGNIENNRLPITLNAMLDRSGVYLKGWNEFLHQEYAEKKAKYMYQEAVSEVNEWTNSKFTY